MWNQWGEEPEPLPILTIYFPSWMHARHEAVRNSCERLGVHRFAYGWPLPAIDGGIMYEIHEFVDGEWVG